MDNTMQVAGSTTEQRLAVILSHPVQHFSPWFRALTEDGRLRLRVLYMHSQGLHQYRDSDFGACFAWDIPLDEGYDHVFLRLMGNPTTSWFDNPNTADALDEFEPDVVLVFGYAQAACWRSLRWARKHGRPILLYSDSDAKQRPARWKQLFKKLIVGRFYSRLSGALYVGASNREYHERFGAPVDRLYPSVLPIDLRRFVEAADARDALRNQVREQYGIPPDAFVVGFIGKFVEHKRPLDLIYALDLLRECDVWALFVGDGPLRPKLQNAVEDLALGRAVLTGFINQSKVPEYLTACDVVAVPSSRDAHPLVVTEAAAVGVPVIVSDAIGCVSDDDSAQPGRNAVVYPCGDVPSLAQAVADLYESPELHGEMSRAAQEIAATQSIDIAVESLVTAVAQCIGVSSRTTTSTRRGLRNRDATT
jgi:glycosyltransferase involved in cell wall biosynthesis